METELITNGHLGGYVKGERGDEATYYPVLWDWMMRSLNVRTVLDVGCGEGHALQWFRNHGARVAGVDGMIIDDPDIDCHDFTTGPYKGPAVDAVWCCEFVEHVDEQFVPNLLSSFRCGRLVFMTHAFPGQAGYHHVNLKTIDYWTGVMAAFGFKYDIAMTLTARGKAASNLNPWNHFLRSGLVFRRIL